MQQTIQKIDNIGLEWIIFFNVCFPSKSGGKGGFFFCSFETNGSSVRISKDNIFLYFLFTINFFETNEPQDGILMDDYFSITTSLKDIFI